MPKIKIDREALEFGERLTKLMEDSGIKRRGAGAYLHKKYKVSTVTANDWLNGRFKANTDTARQIAEDHGTDFDWLYFGAYSKSANRSRYYVAEGDGDLVGKPVEFLDVRGACGGGSMNWDAERREPLIKEPSWFRRYRVTPETALAVWADGDSMAEFIVDGDIVIFDSSKTAPRSGSIFLIDHPDGLRIKRLRRDIDGAWVLESINQDKRRFPDERVDADQAELLKIRGEFVYRQGG